MAASTTIAAATTEAVTTLEATTAANTTRGTAACATATEATTTPAATTAILEQKAANERLQQLTAAEYQKATIEQLEHISVIGGDD